ncbi:MAG TPA: 4-alpha-glucanotransferase, partial [Fibrobacteraceae bacterium]|nr:4-alpha-glucanotransferase [Fibrobacteraceae bacterium]
RIDHVLGFFRIWSIPQTEVTGALGQFNPSNPILRSDLEKKGFKKESLEYLRNPNFSVEQLLPFFKNHFSQSVLNEFFENLPNTTDRFIIKESFRSEKAILNSSASQEVKDALLKVYWNRVFIPSGTEDHYYPFWYWYEQPVLFTLPESEQQLLKSIISENAASQEPLWQENALKLLNVLANETDMLVCAEDLGAIPHCVPFVLNKLNILSLRVERWSRNWDVPYSPYYEMEDYPRLSVATTSCHDTSTLRGLWGESDFDKELFWQHAHQQGMPPEVLYPNHVKGLIENIFSSNSLFCILPIQDYFGLSSQFSMISPELERINIPGTVGPHNWSYRIPCTVEDLVKFSALNADIRSLVDARKRRPIWKI